MDHLEEKSRPTLYRSLKYWGKKPHSIWREIIEYNTNYKDIVYDPFAGSALTFFESLKSGRKPVVADINPLTLFIIEVYSGNYDMEKLITRFNVIKNIVSNTTLYRKNYIGKCMNCGKTIDIYNYRWSGNTQNGYSYKCPFCNNVYTCKESIEVYNEDLGYWKPDLNIASFQSVCSSSLKYFGSDLISDVWSSRNLEILSLIFNLINESDSDLRLPLMFAFLQTLHLTTKMCALRSEKTNRPLSTSWGRPAYMYLKNRMEQNPLLQFERSLFEKNGVIKALNSKEEYLPQYTFSQDIDDIDRVDGIVMLENSKVINGFNADFIITDPPYGPVIQYGELSCVWNCWLEKFDPKYKLNLQDEIIVNNYKGYDKYLQDMTAVLTNCKSILKNNCMVLTFNSNNTQDFDVINKAIINSGFNIKHKFLQKNKRSSEANVSATSNMSISDYYFVLEKASVCVCI